MEFPRFSLFAFSRSADRECIVVVGGGGGGGGTRKAEKPRADALLITVGSRKVVPREI